MDTELQADIKWADNLAGGPGNHGAMNRIMDAARLVANPNLRKIIGSAIRKRIMQSRSRTTGLPQSQLVGVTEDDLAVAVIAAALTPPEDIDLMGSDLPPRQLGTVAIENIHIPDERPGSLDAPWMDEPEPPVHEAINRATEDTHQETLMDDLQHPLETNIEWCMEHGSKRIGITGWCQAVKLDQLDEPMATFYPCRFFNVQLFITPPGATR